MSLAPSSTVPPPSRLQAWTIVAVAALAHLFVVGAPAVALPMIYGPILDEFGLTRSAVSIMASVKMITGAVMAVSSGWLIRQFGVRTVAGFATAWAALSLLAFMAVNAQMGLYVASASLGGSTVLALVTYSVMVSRWFNSNLGVAISIASAGTSIGGAITPFLLNETIPAYGWRAAMALLAPGCFLVLPLVLAFFRLPAAGGEGKAADAADEPAPLGATPAEILRRPTFWIVGTALFLGAFADQSLIQHLVLYLRNDVKIDPTLAAAALGMTFSAGFVGKLLFGYVFDRLSLRGLSVCYAMLAAGAWLMSPALVAIFPVLVSNVFRGLAHGGIIIDIPVAARHCFGPKALGYVIGLWSAASYAGSATGPYVVGALRDRYGDYGMAFGVMIAAAAIAAVLTFVSIPAYRRAVRAKSA